MSEEKGSSFKLPEPPIIAAGGLGGPFCMYLVTPMRNALTFAAQDSSLSLAGVFRQVFTHGLASGWTGGLYPAVAACPQFLCLGPMYHMYASATGPVGGIVLAGATETAVLYGAETRNAQVAVNATGGKIPTARIQSPFMPLGPGVSVNCLRNILAMSGMRVLSEPVSSAISKATGGSKSGVVTFVSDLSSNCCAAAITMPLHMLYQYMAVTPELWDKPAAERMASMRSFLYNQYFPNGKLSSVILRDLALRAGYIATAYTLFSNIERAAVKYWPF